MDIGHIAWSQRISKRKKSLAARPPLKQTFFTHPLQILWATIVSQIVVFYQLPPQEPLVEEWLELRRLAEPLEAELLAEKEEEDAAVVLAAAWQQRFSTWCFRRLNFTFTA